MLARQEIEKRSAETKKQKNQINMKLTKKDVEKRKE